MQKKTNEEEKVIIDNMLEQFTNDMRAKMYAKTDAGFRGFDNEGCLELMIANMTNKAARVKWTHDFSNLDDIANLAMIIWWQKHGKTL